MTRSQALYLKWRPTSFDTVVGQDHVVQTIRNALRSERTVHAYLFCGPRGTGKTTLARLLAKALNCTHSDLTKRPCGTCAHCSAVHEGRFLDLIEIDAASNNSVDDVRDLREKINFAPGQGRCKVYIIDEVHMLSGAAFNALLKTLEEPPPHATFVLATTEAHKVPLTVASRCQQHHFRRVPIAKIVDRLGMIVSEEGMSVEPVVLEMVARQATGSLRDAISLLDQLVVSSEVLVTVERARQVLGTVGDSTVRELVEALVTGHADQGLDLINSTLDEGSDPRQFARQIVDYLRGVLLCKFGNHQLVGASDQARDDMKDHGQHFDTRLLLLALRGFDEAAQNRRSGWLGQLPLELAYLSCLQQISALDSGSTDLEVTRIARQEPGLEALGTSRTATGRTDNSGELQELSPSGSPSASSTSSSQDSRGEHAVLTIVALVSKWNDVVECSRAQHHSLPALLEWCQPRKITEQTVLLGVRQEFAMSRLDNHQMRAGLEQTLADVTGHALRVQFIRSESESNLEDLDISEDGVVALGIELGARLRQR